MTNHHRPTVRALRILHLHLKLGEESCANQFSLPSRHHVSIATFFRAEIPVLPHVRLFEGDGTLRGFGGALSAAFAAGDYDIVHAHGPIDAFLFLVFDLLNNLAMTSTVFTAHHSYTNSNLKLRNRLLLIPIFAAFRKVVCVSHASFRSFPPLYKWLAGARLCAIANGVDLARVDRAINCSRQRRQGAQFTVASVGRLIPIKDPSTVLEAFQEGIESPSRLLFVGVGELSPVLRNRSAASSKDRSIQLVGRLARNEVYRLLAQADLFVSASRGEGMPMAILEAMACGCPVVLSDIAPHREIAEGVDFIPLVAPGDVTGLANEMRRFRNMSVASRLEIGAECRALAERFSLAAMQSRYDDVYVELVGGGRAARAKEDLSMGGVQSYDVRS